MRNPVYLRFNTNRIHLLDVKIEMQKINDKQILSIFISWYHLLVVPYLLNKIKIFDTFTLRGGGPHQILCKKSNNLLDAKGKKINFYQTKMEQKFRKSGQNFCKNEAENFFVRTSKFMKILMKLKKFRSFIFTNFFQQKFCWTLDCMLSLNMFHLFG